MQLVGLDVVYRKNVTSGTIKGRRRGANARGFGSQFFLTLSMNIYRLSTVCARTFDRKGLRVPNPLVTHGHVTH